MIERILTAIIWLYMLFYFAFVLYGIIGKIYGLKNWTFLFYTIDSVNITIQLFKKTFFLAIFIYCVLRIWKEYNYQKFGALNRRKFPKAVTNEEIMKTFQLTREQVEQLQEEKVIILEHNIIPKELD